MLKIIAFAVMILSPSKMLAQDFNRNGGVLIRPDLWILIPSMAIDSEKKLLFRRYAVPLHSENATSFDFQATGMPNIETFNCSRDRRSYDHVTVHLPKFYSLNSFGRDEWVSVLPMRILADNASFGFEAEYLRGNIHLDINANTANDLFKFLNADTSIIEFGKARDRLTLLLRDKTSSGVDVKQLVRDIAPILLRDKNLRYFSFEDVLSKCLVYKKTGRY